MPAPATGLAAGYLLDACLGDPRRRHPVAAFGRLAGAVEDAVHADSRARGVAFWLGCTVPAVAAAALAGRARGPVPTAVVVWAVLGRRSLLEQARGLADELEQGDLQAARERLPALCGRDPSELDGPALARAGVESVAENASDAVVAPLLWGALLGLPGLVGYRVVNTLDAMVGHRSARHRRFGWAAARADDVANLLPARLTALLTCLAAGTVGGRGADAWRVWRRDGSRHPSPNAGRCEAAAAGALGVRLGGANVYAGEVERRGELGDGRLPGVADLRRAVRLADVVCVLGLAASGGVSVTLARARARARRAVPR